MQNARRTKTKYLLIANMTFPVRNPCKEHSEVLSTDFRLDTLVETIIEGIHLAANAALGINSTLLQKFSSSYFTTTYQAYVLRSTMRSRMRLSDFPTLLMESPRYHLRQSLGNVPKMISDTISDLLSIKHIVNRYSNNNINTKNLLSF